MKGLLGFGGGGEEGERAQEKLVNGANSASLGEGDGEGEGEGRRGGEGATEPSRSLHSLYVCFITGV